MYTNKEDLLTQAKTLLQGEMTGISYNTWIKSLEISSCDNNKIVLIAQSKMQKDAIEARLFDLVVNTFNYITNTSCEVTIIEKEEVEPQIQSNTINFSNTESYSNSCLNPKYTFDNFVVGNNNKFAHAAALAVARSSSNYI